MRLIMLVKGQGNNLLNNKVAKSQQLSGQIANIFVIQCQSISPPLPFPKAFPS